MGCEDSELWITYQQNSRGGKPFTTQLIELEFQSHKLIDLEDVLDHVFAQGWVEAHYRSIAWWEKCDGTKLKNSERVETLLKQGAGKCESTSLKLVIADCPPALWISYVFLKGSNAHASVQRINLIDAADPCCKIERLAHVSNYVFRKGYLPANVRSFVHWEDACKRRLEEHLCVKDVLCDRGVGKDEDKPLRLVIGLDFAFVAGWIKLEADSGSFKTIRPVHVPANVESRDTVEGEVKVQSRVALIEQNLERVLDSHSIPPSPSYERFPPTFFSKFSSSSSHQSLSLTPPSTSSRASTVTENAHTLWTIHYILFGTLLFLSWAAVLYPRIYSCCEHCRHQ